ncbi:GPCR kinase [Tanacetum coccineum]
MTMKDLSGTIPGTIHYKVIGDGGYRNDITVGAALILANISVFSPKPFMHYLNITMRNVVKVFRKDTIPGSDSEAIELFKIVGFKTINSAHVTKVADIWRSDFKKAKSCSNKHSAGVGMKSCSPNATGDLTVIVKDLSSTIPGTIHYKVIGDGGYGKDITVFRKDTVPGSGSG